MAATASQEQQPRVATVEPGRVLEALGSEQCRAILAAVADESLTAQELGTALSIPLSTLYRHLAELADAGLLRESVRIDTGGRNQQEYSRTHGGLAIRFDEGLRIEPTV